MVQDEKLYTEGSSNTIMWAYEFSWNGKSQRFIFIGIQNEVAWCLSLR